MPQTSCFSLKIEERISRLKPTQLQSSKINRRNKLFLFFFSFLFVLNLTTLLGQTDPNLLAANYWNTSGVQGGIPTITSNCGTVYDLSQLQNVINNCNGGVINIPAGTYDMSGYPDITLKDNVVIRGAGTTKTIIVGKFSEGFNDYSVSYYSGDYLKSPPSYNRKNYFFQFEGEFSGIEDLTIKYIPASDDKKRVMPDNHFYGDNDTYEYACAALFYSSWCKSSATYNWNTANNPSNLTSNYPNYEMATHGVFFTSKSSNNWLNNVYIEDVGSFPIKFHGKNNTVANCVINGAQRTGGGGNGYLLVEGTNNLFIYNWVKRIRHFDIDNSRNTKANPTTNNVIYGNLLEVDVNFHSGGIQNLIQNNTIFPADWHTFPAFSTGVYSSHTPPDRDNYLFKNSAFGTGSLNNGQEMHIAEDWSTVYRLNGGEQTIGAQSGYMIAENNLKETFESFTTEMPQYFPYQGTFYNPETPIQKKRVLIWYDENSMGTDDSENPDNLGNTYRKNIAGFVNSIAKQYERHVTHDVKGLEVEYTEHFDLFYDKVIIVTTDSLGLDTTKYTKIQESQNHDFLLVDPTASSSIYENEIEVFLSQQVFNEGCPSLFLEGARRIIIELNEEFTDLGATWTDSIDGSGVIDIATEGNVDISMPGEYVLTYSYTNSEDCKVSVTRIVVVDDEINTCPTIDITGGNITIFINDIYTELGATYFDEEDGYGTIGTSDLVDTETVGEYTLNYQITDSGGCTVNASRTVRVEEESTQILATSLFFNSNESTIYFNTIDDVRLPSFTALPENRNLTSTWVQSSDESIVLVNPDGSLTGLKEGRVILTIRTFDGSDLSDSVELVIGQYEETILFQSFNWNTDFVIMEVGEVDLPSSTFVPEKPTKEQIWVKSQNPDIASVNSNGFVVAKKPGTITISGTTLDGTNITDSFTLTVVEKLPEITIENAEAEEGSPLSFRIYLDVPAPLTLTCEIVINNISTNNSDYEVSEENLLVTFEVGQTEKFFNLNTVADNTEEINENLEIVLNVKQPSELAKNNEIKAIGTIKQELEATSEPFYFAPNPAQANSEINLQNVMPGKYQIIIYDFKGSIHRNDFVEFYSSSLIYEVPNLASGLYILSLSNLNENYVSKLIIN